MMIRAHFDGKVLVPDEPVDLPLNEQLELDVKQSGGLRRGSPARLLAFLNRASKAPHEAVDEMERHIKEAERPSIETGIFDDERE